jgi:hypothetical protein
MISRIGSGYELPSVVRVRQVESGPAARSSSEARQAGAQAAAVVRNGAEARARAAASAAEARSAAATPRESRQVELEAAKPRALPDFFFQSFAQSLPSGDAASPRVTLEQFTDQLARARLEQ